MLVVNRTVDANTIKTNHQHNKQATPQKKEVITHQSVKQYIHMYQPNPQTPKKEGPVKVVLVVNRTVDANTPKNKQFIVSYRSISTSKLVTLQCLHS